MLPKATVLARAQPGACASSLTALCLVHVLRAQHSWAAELARTNRESLSTEPLFPAPSGNVASKVQVSSTVRQVASIFGMPLDTESGAHRYSRHTFRATWGNVPHVLWDRRLENPAAWPLGFQCCPEECGALASAHSLSLEVSLGGDLRAIQKQALAIKAELAQSEAPFSLRELQDVYQDSQGERLSSTTRVLAIPPVREVLELPAGRWSRMPFQATCWSSMK